jgi:hypothetical protein
MTPDFGRYAAREYERRWLLRNLPPELDPSRPAGLITDHYIDNTRLRLREQRDLGSGRCIRKLGQKFPERDGQLDVIVITNIYLNEAEYRTFLALPARRIVKHTWALDHNGRRYVIDAFRESLEGLILAECEYATEPDMRAAPAPRFDGVEVTSMPEFTGGELAGRSFDDIRHFLA